MKIGLIAEDSKLPNYALMKVFAYHKSKGDEVDFALPFEYYKTSDFKDFEIRKNFKCINHFK